MINVMNKKVLIALSAVLMALPASATGIKYVLSGKASTEMEGKKVYMTVLGENGNKPSDSTLVSKGQFVFKGERAIPIVASVMSKIDPKSIKSTLVVLESGTISINFSTEKSQVKGGKLNEALTAFSDSMSVLGKERQASNLDKMMAQYRDSSTTDEQRKETMKLYNQFNSRLSEMSKSLIETNINNAVGAFIFANFEGMYSNEEKMAILDKAGKDFKSNPLIENITKQLAAVKKRSAGNPYMDFELQDANGKMHKLSEYIGAGKYILLDFWASWCGPCRAEMPHVKAAYEKYHSKGFDIVSVSFDSKKEDWLKAIDQLGMTWNHLSDLKGWKCAVAPIYGIKSIPCTVLIGPDGIIIGGDYRGEELEKKLSELM